METRRLKRLKKAQNREERREYLSELPEHVLHHILSYLTMKDVIMTSVLSKMWRYIWLYVPCLNFSPIKKPKIKDIAFITRSLLLHKGPKIQKLNINFNYRHSKVQQIDSWFYFALTRDVNELYLDSSVRDVGPFGVSRYRLPQIIFSFRSLTILSLRKCDIDLGGNSINFRLSFLKILSLEEVNFVGGAINDLITSSPILECLSIKNCSLGDDFDLHIKNVRVKTLKIIETHSCFSNCMVAVNAPLIISFELVPTMSRKSYVIEGMQYLESASVDCKQQHPYCTLLKAKDNDHSIVKILGEVCHVKDLRLSSCYLQALSRREVHGLGFSSFDVKCLRIRTGLTKEELPGLNYMLRHSPNVETLIIDIDEFAGNQRHDLLNCKSNGEYWRLQDPSFSTLLCNLKTVKLYNFMTDLNKHQMCNWEIHQLADELENDMNILRFLLRNSKVLERMIILTCKRVKLGRKTESKKLKMLSHLTQDLFAVPRASRDAEISFR